MNKVNEYYTKLVSWVKKNPTKATLIGIFCLGLLIGAILF
jgi:hypothetical protein